MQSGRKWTQLYQQPEQFPLNEWMNKYKKGKLKKDQYKKFKNKMDQSRSYFKYINY